MLEFKGRYNDAKVFNANLDKVSTDQVYELLNNESFKDSKIRYMPDIHAGAGCTIGTTMTITDKVVPNFVGVDIGCGVIFAKLKDKEIDFAKLDKVVRKFIPSGFAIRKTATNVEESEPLVENLRCLHKLKNSARFYTSIGSLGGGNHFIEVNKGSDGTLYLAIHSGSRNLGKQVCTYYQRLAISELRKTKGAKNFSQQSAYLQGELMDDYLHDMSLVQKYAQLNRRTMLDILVDKMEFTVVDINETVHNYIEMETMILRKGAVSAKKGEILIIPINMAYGSLLCEGKGNPDWNYSASHGAGRLMSRTKAKKEVCLKEFRSSMDGVYSTSVGRSTLDEAPMAYKDVSEIKRYMEPTVKILDVIKSVYNFKAN